MTLLTLSIGKVRALQQCATANGIFTILAADHRDAMRIIIDEVRSFSGLASAVLLDPLYSAGQAIAGGACGLTGRTGGSGLFGRSI
jgi:tagatose-1,6-bisphosphate aldolase